MIASKKLIKQKKISHGFFNKKGGKSNGIYKSLNCGPGSKDKKNKVKQNLKIVKNKINKNAKKIFLVHQIHSNKFIFIDKHFRVKKKRIIADAIITNQRKHAKTIDAGSGYLCQMEPVAHYGIRKDEKDFKVEVKWTDGTKNLIKIESLNQAITIKQK